MKKILVWETLSMISGGQRMTLTVMDLMKNKYEFHCLIPRIGAFSAALDVRGIPYTLLGDQTMPTGVKDKKVIFRYAWLSMKAISGALCAIAKFRPDIIYTPGPAALPWSAICGKLTHKSVVWHLHHIFLDGMTLRLINLFSGYDAVKKIISVSDVVGVQITNSEAQRKKTTIYNPVDFSKFSSGDGKKILDELGIDGADKLIIGQVALLQSSKRQDVVVRAAAALKGKGYDVRVLLVGRARDEDDGYVARLHGIIADSGMIDEVFLLGQRSDIPDILDTVDMIMIPSSFEGFPLAGLEAAVAGCPVLAANVGGAKEFIKVSRAGECFDSDDINDAAVHVLSVLENKSEYSREGRNFALRCTLGKYDSEIRNIFNDVI